MENWVKTEKKPGKIDEKLNSKSIPTHNFLSGQKILNKGTNDTL